VPGPRSPSQEGTPIDIIFLVERLESLIANGKKLPLTTNVVVDQNAALGLIDELRVAVPEEVRAAKRINAEGERIIEKAQDEAERIVAKAQEQAAFLIDERGLTEAAHVESQRIIDEAQGDADAVRHGADEYAVNVLAGLESDVAKTLQSIKKGIALLDERRADLLLEPPAMPIEVDDCWAGEVEDVPQPLRT
jgi:cell division septum initiation protein DivIVA